MKTPPTTRCVLCIALLIALLCGNLQAGPDFFDDFSDGDTIDGSPLNWIAFMEAPNGHTGAIAAALDGIVLWAEHRGSAGRIQVPHRAPG